MHAGVRHSSWSPVILSLPGLLFEGVVRLRNRAYDSDFFARRRLPQPVLSIGNLTVGGSGKTPLAIYMAQVLARMGRTPILLSRGYGRSTGCPRIVQPFEQVPFPAQELGDEPALIRRHAPEIWLGVSSDRYAIGLQIGPRVRNPVFILDDGFQHRRLRRNLDLVVIDRSQPLAGNRVLPRGTLREPLSSLKRADMLVINGAFSLSHADPVEELIRRFNANAAIVHCVQKIDRLVDFADWRAGGADGLPRRDRPEVFLAAAIGNPERFRTDVQNFGIETRGGRFFRDHFCLRPRDWRACAEAARRNGAAALLTTEKDAIKIRDELDFPLLVAVQSLRLTEQAVMERRLQSLIEDQS